MAKSPFLSWVFQFFCDCLSFFMLLWSFMQYPLGSLHLLAVTYIIILVGEHTGKQFLRLVDASESQDFDRIPWPPIGPYLF